MRLIWRQILAWLATAALRKHQVQLIAIVGDGQNALLRELIFQVINIQYPARQNAESLAAEFGIPLTILGYDGYAYSRWEWLGIVIKSFLRLLKPRQHNHVIILELEAIDARTRDFWLRTLKPRLVIDTTGEIDSVSSAQDKAIQVGEQFDIDPEISQVILEDIDLPEAKVSIHPGVDGSTIIDATHYFYPTNINSVAEMFSEDLEVTEKIVINPSSKDFSELGPDEWQFNPPQIVPSPDTLIILRGYRPVIRYKYRYLFLD